MKITPIILCGGQGSRLWPSSRQNIPKHFLRLNSDLSLLQETILRFEDDRFNNPIIISNINTEFLLKDQLREINCEDFKIILEPAQRSTAASICLGSLLAHNIDQNSKVLVVSADLKISNFINLIEDCFNAEDILEDSFVVFGKNPSFPNTEFGYIKKSETIQNNFFEVESFKEKPNKTIAKKYVDSGRFFWNLGIFLFTTKNFFKSMEKHQLEILNICRSALDLNNKLYEVDKNTFNKLPSISIDYALMEKINNITVCETAIEWEDLGSWKALKRHHENNKSVYSEDSENIFVNGSKQKKYIFKDVPNINVIDNEDVMMITNDGTRNEELISFFDNAKKQFPSLNTYENIDYRPWGMYKVLIANNDYKIKYIEILPNQKLSLQKHKYRSEHWTILEGTPYVTINNEIKILKANDHIFIKAGDIHRIENPSEQKVSFIEIQLGTYFGEDDIERLEDDYGRIDKEK
tara:strand:- start:1962 stop:3356 length:1395 start_codon:yes stop_codon:yes gene_type:complete